MNIYVYVLEYSLWNSNSEYSYYELVVCPVACPISSYKLVGFFKCVKLDVYICHWHAGPISKNIHTVNIERHVFLFPYWKNLYLCYLLSDIVGQGKN